MGTIRNFGDVWYNHNSLANILSMADVRKVCRITMDTSVKPAMTIHRRDGSQMKKKLKYLLFSKLPSNLPTSLQTM
jgi:hypothetical protein